LTTNDNSALRVVSGTASTGGSTPFTTCFTDDSVTSSFSSSLSVGSYTLSTSEIPSHAHPTGGGSATPIGQAYFAPTSPGLIYQTSGSQNIGPAGGGGSHSHTNPPSTPGPVTFPGGTLQTLSLRYIDVIQCSRN
jgi:hypothetical protein